MPHDGTDKGDNLQHTSTGDRPACSSYHYNEDRYLPMIAELDATDEQKQELLQTLFSIMVSIADLGLGLDPVQMLMSEPSENTSLARADQVKSPLNPTRKPFERAVNNRVNAPGESADE